jgi:protein ImuA
MGEARRQDILTDLRALVRAQKLGARPSGPIPTLPFGLAEIDAALPSGGLALGAVHEVYGGGADLIHGAAAAGFAAGILARTIGPVIWVVSHKDLFAPALATVGLDPDRVIYVEAGDSQTVLLAIEEALRHVGLAGVVGEVSGKVGLSASRRLQSAAEGSGALGLLLRRPRRLGQDDTDDPTAARTRWRVTAILNGSALPGSSSTPGRAGAKWQLELLCCRGGEPRSFTVEACNAMGHLGVPAEAAGRSAAANEAPRRHGMRPPTSDPCFRPPLTTGEINCLPQTC